MDIESRDGKLSLESSLILSNDWCIFLLIKGLFGFQILIKHVKYGGLLAKGLVFFKQYTFLRINSRNQPFIYLQSYDILGFDY